MQERTATSSMDQKVYLNNLKNNPRITADMLRLIEEDLRFGLTTKETDSYIRKKPDYAQMKVYSRCLRGGYEQEVVDVITKDGLTGEQMAVALEFYEKGIPLSAVKEITENTGQTAFTMKKLFQNITKRADMVEKKPDTEEAYAKELLSQIKEVVAKIEFQEKRYDALNEKLKEMQTTGQDSKIQNNLLIQLSDKDKMLETQQNEVNEARVTIARLRKELEDAGKEKAGLEKIIEEMKQAAAGITEKPQNNPVKVTTAALKEANPVPDDKNRKPQQPSYPWTDYQAALLDEAGNIVQMIPIERTQKKKDNRILSAIFSRVTFKKKIDIVKLVAEEDLSPKQLVQIRSAIEKGLNEKQLMVLITYHLPPDQMEEIIQIAEYENKQREEAAWD